MNVRHRATAVVSIAASLLLTACLTPAWLLAADAKANLLKPANQADSWRLEQIEGGKATFAADGDAGSFDVTATDAEEWHVQTVQTGLKLVDGKEYVLTFKAKASADRNMTVNAMVDVEDWHDVGLAETAEVTKEWKDFKYEFKAANTAKEAGKNRVTFVLGNEKGKVWLKDVTLTEK